MAGFGADPFKTHPRIQGKTFVFCIPGRNFSREFMLSLFELLFYISTRGGKFRLSVQYNPVVNASRCMCLGADVRRGKNQKPFGGEVKYDYLMWIDSDIVFNETQFLRLLEMNKDIASGWYAQPGPFPDGSLPTPVVEHMDDEFFKANGAYEFLTSLDMEQKTKPFKADYIGFGWALIKRGVFEKLEYPWFAPRMLFMDGNIQEYCSEDVAFCTDAKNAGFEIWVDPKCRVGHEKNIVI